MAGDQPRTAIGYFIAGGALFTILVWRAVARNRAAQGENELHALDGALHAVYAILTANKPDTHKLRICVFVPNPGSDTVHQVTDYVFSGEPYGRNRDLSSRCGIVGMAFRTGLAKYGKLPSGVTFVDHMVAEYGFSREEAAGMREDRRSWAAMPVGDAGRVVAVIYVDSALRDFFGKANSVCRRIIDAAAIGVATFISRT